MPKEALKKYLLENGFTYVSGEYGEKLEHNLHKINAPTKNFSLKAVFKPPENMEEHIADEHVKKLQEVLTSNGLIMISWWENGEESGKRIHISITAINRYETNENLRKAHEYLQGLIVSNPKEAKSVTHPKAARGLAVTTRQKITIAPPTPESEIRLGDLKRSISGYTLTQLPSPSFRPIHIIHASKNDAGAGPHVVIEIHPTAGRINISKTIFGNPKHLEEVRKALEKQIKGFRINDE